MADIYTRMAEVANRLLVPASDAPGTFGQGNIQLVRYVPGPPPANEWDPPSEPVPTYTTLKGAARGVSEELVGSEIAPGVQLKSTDLIVIVAPWGVDGVAGEYATGDVMEIDEVPHTIMRVDRIPAAGVVSAFRFYVRGPSGGSDD